MGEARVKVKLTNAVDQALVRRGLLEPEQVRTYEADALVDTGSVRCTLLRQQSVRATTARRTTLGPGDNWSASG